MKELCPLEAGNCGNSVQFNSVLLIIAKSQQQSRQGALYRKVLERWFLMGEEEEVKTTSLRTCPKVQQ